MDQKILTTMARLAITARAAMDSIPERPSVGFPEEVIHFFTTLSKEEGQSLNLIKETRDELPHLITNVIRYYCSKGYIVEIRRLAEILNKHPSLHGAFLDELKRHPQIPARTADEVRITFDSPRQLALG